MMIRLLTGVALCSVLLVSCSDDTTRYIAPSNQSNARWMWAEEISPVTGAVPTENHTVVMKLATAPGLTVRTFPYTFTTSGRHSYCITEDDPVFRSMTLTDSSGKTLGSVKTGECVETDIQAGTYQITMTMDQSAIPAQGGRLAFIGREHKLRLLPPPGGNNNLNQSTPLNLGKLALVNAKGLLMTLSPSAPLDKKNDYYLVAVPMRAVSTNDLFSFVPDSVSGAYRMASAQGPMAGFAPKYDRLTRKFTHSDPGYGNCGIKVDPSTKASVQSPLFTYSGDYNGIPPLWLVSLSDLGNNAFTLSVYDKDNLAGGGYFPVSFVNDTNSATNGTACFATGNGANPDQYQVLFRYYDDGTQITALQEGEVALYTGVNYTGSAWVIARTLPDFSAAIAGLARSASSMKLGPNTSVVLSAKPNTQDPSAGIYKGSASIADLGQTSVGAKKAQALYINPTITNFTLSTVSCRYCDLTGITIPPGMSLGSILKTTDFTGAIMPNAVFTDGYVNNINFSSAILTGITFNKTVLMGPAPYTNINFSGAVMDSAAILGTFTGQLLAMENINLSGASLKKSTISNAYLAVNALAGADFSGATITGSALGCATESACFPQGTYKIKFNNAVVTEGNTSNTYFIVDALRNWYMANSAYCDFHGTVFTNTFPLNDVNNYGSLAYADFSGAIFADGMNVSNGIGGLSMCDDLQSLTGCANFTGVTMHKANFSSQDLRGANFTNADLRGSNFSNAKLNRTNLQGANLSTYVTSVKGVPTTIPSTFAYTIADGANFDGAKLCGANMTTKPSSLWMTSFKGALLRNTLLSNVQLSYADFSNANFYGDLTQGSNICQATEDICQSMTPATCASATNSVITNANFTGALLANVDFTGAEFYGMSLDNAMLINANLSGSNIGFASSVGMNSFKSAWLHSASFKDAKLDYSDFTGAFANKDYVANSASSCYVLQLDASHTQFNGYWGVPGQTACIKVKPTQNTLFPVSTGNAIICPDGSKCGSFSEAHWNFGTPDPARFASSLHCATLPANCAAVDLNW